jgi:hypothetical protein
MSLFKGISAQLTVFWLLWGDKGEEDKFAIAQRQTVKKRL